MTHPAWKAVLPIRGHLGHIIGTGVAVLPGRVLTALHVVDPEPAGEISVAGRAVAGKTTLPWRHFGVHRKLARESYHRTRALTEIDAGTLDLALLAVPELDAPVLAVRREPVRDGEYVTIGGYPAGRWTFTSGPVTSHDEADFVAHVILGPGASGAPALDINGRLVGLVTMDHATAGAILIGPTLIGSFLERTVPLLAHVRARDRRGPPAGTPPTPACIRAR